jgi:hypothetical protein
MGRFHPKRISDLLKVNAHLRVTCAGCRRMCVFDVRAVLQWFTSRRTPRNEDWTIAGSYFRCEECGHRGAELGWVPPPTDAGPAPLIESRDQVKQRQRRERG